MTPTDEISSTNDRSSLDIIVPVVREPEQVVERLAELEVPLVWMTTAYLVVNEQCSIPEPTEHTLSNGIRVEWLVSDRAGVSAARNTGLDASTGNWILFLDDDVRPAPDLLKRYAEGIKDRGNSITGMVGLTCMPSPPTRFARGVKATHMPYFYEIARWRDKVSWGVTANLFLLRDAVGDIRFSPAFSGAGGGEEVDFCLRVVERTGQLFDTRPEAEVVHPWWGGAKRHYHRFFRWATGDALLRKRHPDLQYRDFPNAVETLFVMLLGLLPLFIIGHLGPSSLLAAPVGIFIAAVIEEAIDFRRTGVDEGLLIAVEATLVQFTNDFGTLYGNLCTAYRPLIGHRFDYHCTGEYVTAERKINAVSFALYILTTVAAIQLV